jgi:hypothetical protein
MLEGGTQNSGELCKVYRFLYSNGTAICFIVSDKLLPSVLFIQFAGLLFRRVLNIAIMEDCLRHVCPSIRMEQLCSHLKNFHEI